MDDTTPAGAWPPARDGAPMPMPIILDALGAIAGTAASPSGLTPAVFIDLEGFRNRPPSGPPVPRTRQRVRFMASPGQVGELVAELTAAASTSPELAAEFMAGYEDAAARVLGT